MRGQPKSDNVLQFYCSRHDLAVRVISRSICIYIDLGLYRTRKCQSFCGRRPGNAGDVVSRCALPGSSRRVFEVSRPSVWLRVMYSSSRVAWRGFLSTWVSLGPQFFQVLGLCRFCVLPNPFLEVCWSGVREASLAHVAELAVAEAGRSGRRRGIADGALLSLDRCYQDLRLDYHIDVSVQTSYYFSFFLSPFFYSTTFSFFLPSLHLPPFPVSSLSLYGGKNYDYTCCI